jgi:hypothetical protein
MVTGAYAGYQHPALCNIPPKVPEQESCFHSWIEYLKEEEPPDITVVVENSTIRPTVYGWETIKSFGENITSIDCTGISRIRFKSPPTTNTTSSFSVTVWEEVYYSWDTQYHWKNEQSKTARRPQCSFRSEVRDYYCYKLDLEDELGFGKYTKGFARKPDETLCPMRTDCSPAIEEVVLLYWPNNITSLRTCDSVEHYSSIFDGISRVDRAITTPVVITKSEITFKGRDLYLRSINGQELGQYVQKHLGEGPIKDLTDEYAQYTGLWEEGLIQRLEPSVMTGRWVFTSPTIYLAHRPISLKITWAEQDASVIDYIKAPLSPEGIIEIKAEDISTVMPRYNSMRDEDYARLVANGSYSFTRSKWWENNASQTLPLNFDDLQDPVPARSYYDARMDCWGQQSHCAIITEGSFRPKLRLARGVWASIFSTYPCHDGIVVDPPIELRQIHDGLPDARLSTNKATATPTPSQPPNSPESLNSGSGNPFIPQPGSSVGFHQPAETGTSSNHLAPGANSPVNINGINGIILLKNNPSGFNSPKVGSLINNIFNFLGWYPGDEQAASGSKNNVFDDLRSGVSFLLGAFRSENGFNGAVNPGKSGNKGDTPNGGPMTGSNGRPLKGVEGLASRPGRVSSCIWAFIPSLALVTWF